VGKIAAFLPIVKKTPEKWGTAPFETPRKWPRSTVCSSMHEIQC
jgi:hypothetical protein